VGNQIGVGKESGSLSFRTMGEYTDKAVDIYVVADEEGEQMALKLHRYN
jgi:RIO-like serine/threonine protein kinase